MHWFLEMLPILQAEEALQHMTEQAMGAGTVEEHERKRIFATWQRLAEGDLEGKRPRQSEAQFKAALAAMGIGFEQHRRDGGGQAS
jgi:hypothetical protein